MKTRQPYLVKIKNTLHSAVRCAMVSKVL